MEDLVKTDDEKSEKMLNPDRENLSMISQFLIGLVVLTTSMDGNLLTVAERTEFKATARYSEVIEFGEKLTKSSPLVKLSEIGRTREGRSIPLWIVSDPPITTPQAAKDSGKAVVLLMGISTRAKLTGRKPCRC